MVVVMVMIKLTEKILSRLLLITKLHFFFWALFLLVDNSFSLFSFSEFCI